MKTKVVNKVSRTVSGKGHNKKVVMKSGLKKSTVKKARYAR